VAGDLPQNVLVQGAAMAWNICIKNPTDTIDDSKSYLETKDCASDVGEKYTCFSEVKGAAMYHGTNGHTQVVS